MESPKPLLLLGFTLILGLVVAATVISLGRVDQFRDQFDSVVADHHVRVRLGADMQRLSRKRTILLHELVQEQDPFRRDESFQELLDLGEAFLVARSALLNHRLSDTELGLLERQSKLSRIAGDLQIRVIELANQDRMEEARQLLIQEAIPAQDESLALLEEFVARQEQYNRSVLDTAHQNFASTRTLIHLLGGSLTLVCLLIAATIYVRITGMIGMLSQSRRKQRSINLELKENERRERAIRENILEAIITIDEQGIITSCNPAVERMFGYETTALIGRNISMLMPEPDSSHHDMYLERYLRTGEAHIIGHSREVQGQRSNGEVFPLDLGVTEIRQGGQRHFIGVLRDVTEQRLAEQALRRARDELERRVAERTEELLRTNRLLRDEITEHKETQARLEHLASHDPLTGLPNRHLFTEHLQLTLARAERHGQQCALLYIDLDGFKPINDRLGHETGDKVLREVALRLKDTIRREDLVSRIGGDEFTVILGSGEGIREVAREVAGKILQKLEIPFLHKGERYPLGASIGISLYPMDADEPEAMLRNADAAMYEVKRGHKHDFLFFDGLSAVHDQPESRKDELQLSE